MVKYRLLSLLLIISLCFGLAGCKKVEEVKKTDWVYYTDYEEVEVEVEKEVEVEVEPSDDYCNIKIHYVWPILFFISLALNLGFIALIVVYVVRRKKNQTDDTPLVDYDIDDAE